MSYISTYCFFKLDYNIPTLPPSYRPRRYDRFDVLHAHVAILGQAECCDFRTLPKNVGNALPTMAMHCQGLATCCLGLAMHCLGFGNALPRFGNALKPMRYDPSGFP